MIDTALPDPRRHAYRGDLAAESLRGLVEARRFVKGEPRQVSAPSLPLRREPRFDATLDTEALLGETVTVYDESEGWAWVQLSRDCLCRLRAERRLDAAPGRRRRIGSRRCAPMSTPSPTARRRLLALLSLNARIACQRDGGQVPRSCRRRLCLRRSCRADRRDGARFRRGGRGVSRHALSLGRTHEHRP